MKKVILGLSLLALVANVSLAHDKEKGSKCCSTKMAASHSKSKSKCCAEMTKSAKAEKVSDKKAVKKTA
ncbi:MULTISPECIES: hypothetical protein [unclassified Arcicella]|uniref:hypothetical protein n=1 Tax=unclassified Arcicella TaxID=2644986 RepID=UPI00286787C7|nr:MULTISPECIES: hypothetical protein [unclassified Arcicella]MDR6563176.1 hypothetical protein [Arcicella sp. BE51]MDR6811673.1 hypothetical protein [Arcicella sp. BE140]MDR6823198.1 hypothetical protein [Arcicella sp. BE139]